MIVDGLVFDPVLGWPIVAVITACGVVATVAALWWQLSGWLLRAAAFATVIVALMNPSIAHRDGVALADIVVAVVDKTESQTLGNRVDQTDVALAHLERVVAARAGTELHVVRVADGAGTELMAGLGDALRDLPTGRVAGIVMITDGRVHDMDATPDLPAPLHVFLTGDRLDWDRHLDITDAPKFGVIGDEITVGLRINDIGAVPNAIPDQAILSVTVGDAAPVRVPVPTDKNLTMPLRLTHGGTNAIRFSIEAIDGELTDRNNDAIVEINGVRDRLRVLLVSGQPHAGQRTWRNLLKADNTVDLVHFTILRPAGKNDFVPRDELSLIAIPTNDLFNTKINDFDLIIFDRYKRRGILPRVYLQNVVDYVHNGGAVLLAAGPDFATADSLYYSPLADILPAAPTGEVIETGFLPALSELGMRHPVTQTLAGNWGRWMRQIALTPTAGDTVMTGVDGNPLLQLARVGEGRVALLGSDHAWLWTRGFEGGGPQAELLRRLAHWMMKEPELDEEKLWGAADQDGITIWRRSLADNAEDVTVTAPDGSTTLVPMISSGRGVFRGMVPRSGAGLYRLSDDQQSVVLAVGDVSPREYERPVATGDILRSAVDVRRGGVFAITDGLPRMRDAREGRIAAGRGWMGIWPRDAQQVLRVTHAPIAPAWAYLLLISGLMICAWLREGRR